MPYQRFKLSQTVGSVGSVGAGILQPASRAIPTTVKNKLVSYIEQYQEVNEVFQEKDQKPVASMPAPTVPTVPTLHPFEVECSPFVIETPPPAPDYRAALAAFKITRARGATRFRHDQACWAAEMFLNEWSSWVAQFEWTTADIFDPPRGDKCGLAYWLGVEIVTAFGPEHAVTESDRVYDRITRTTWVKPKFDS